MGKPEFGRHGAVRAAAVMALAGLVAGCGGSSFNPAPLVLKGADSGIAGQAESAPAPRDRRVVVWQGQSLAGIAHAYHVSERAIIAANHLKPPYKLAAGQHLLIPGTAESMTQQPLATAASSSPGHPPPEIIPLDGPAPARSTPAETAQPTPKTAGLTPPPESALAPGQGAAQDARAEPTTTPGTAAALPRGSHFPWPVRGHVLAGYGTMAGGSRNDGINIAAPRGTPVTAVDAGTVAYAGNELRGYGNLILIKHSSGWITAYAHCEELLVKRGDTVTPGQAIAKVGATGGVSEPQLHFELRRGKHAVDPREFLAPAPRADKVAHQG